MAWCMMAPTMNYCQVDPQEQNSVKFLSNTMTMIEESTFENIVSKMATILFQSQCVQPFFYTRDTIQVMCLAKRVFFQLKAKLIELRAPPQYKDHLSQLWGFSC